MYYESSAQCEAVSGVNNEYLVQDQVSRELSQSLEFNFSDQS